jgi:short-subunit dehydrogenase
VETNFLGVLYGTLRILPLMKARRKGHLIVVGSLGGIVPMPFESLYCATKFAVRGFFLSLREELRRSGIDVSLISPGPVDTMMLRTEARSDESTMAFVESPLTAERVAGSIVQVIRNKQAETLLPARTKIPALLMGAFPALFTALYPLLNLIGAFRLKIYRDRGAQMTPSTTGAFYE